MPGTENSQASLIDSTSSVQVRDSEIGKSDKLSRYVNLYSDKEAANSASSETFLDLVEIIVGSTKTRFLAHTAAICAKSDFFKAACNERWESGRTRTVTLEDYDVGHFTIFMCWLVTGELNKASSYVEVESNDETKMKTSLEKQWKQLAACRILGDFLQASDFKNSVMDSLQKNQRIYDENCSMIGGSGFDDILLVWANTVTGSPLRRILLDKFAGFSKLLLSPSNLKPCQALVDFYYDLASLMIKNRKTQSWQPNPWNQNPCIYYEHPGKPSDYSCTTK